MMPFISVFFCTLGTGISNVTFKTSKFTAMSTSFIDFTSLFFFFSVEALFPPPAADELVQSV